MIAIGGSVGTGLLIGSGSSLRTGGPAALLIAWGLVGTMVFCTIHALGEMCVAFPVSGAFSSYATRFVDPFMGVCSRMELCYYVVNCASTRISGRSYVDSILG